MDILLQPDALSLVGSMSNFVIYSESDVVFIIKDHDSNRVIVQHTYNPSDTNRVEVNVKDIIQPLLTFDMRDSSVAWQQTSIIKKFDVTVYDVVKEGVASTTKNVSFDVIRAGVDNFADSAENFLTQNFLTWQPNMKAVTYYSPEYLTYYAVVAAVVKCKTYIKGQEATIALADIAAGTCWTIPVTYSVIAGLAKDLPEYYDIWVENAQGSRLTYIQRYYAADIKSEDEEWFLFENSLGGVDSFRAYGDNQMTAEHTHNIAEIEDESEEYRVDTNRKHKKNTGFIDKKERSWLLDFFPSLAKYVYAGSALRRITVTESDASYTSSDTPSSYSFTYKLSDTNPYLNLPRADIPQGAMDIKVPDVGSFTIAPRLVEFPRQTLSGGALFPVQNPYSENWAVTTAAALFTFIVNQLEANYANNGRIGHTHPNIDLLNGLSVLEGYLLSDGNKIKASFADDVAEASATLKKFIRNDKDGEANGVIDFKQGLKIVGKAIAAIITSKDTTEFADTNIFSALKACATFLRKDQEDVTEFLVKFLGGIITDSIKSQNFLQGILGAGFGLFMDGDKSYLQVDKLLVTAKAIFASLEIRKLSYVGGNFIFSAAGATLTKVEEISTGWRCYIHTDDGTTATSNMWAVGDMAKCQTFNVKPGVYANVSNRYYWRKVDAVGDNYIDISATDHDTSVDNDVPQVGDVLVQQGNKTDPTRQNMNAIMTVGEEAPAFIQYIGINDYDLNSHRRITISPKGNKIIADSYLVEIDGKQETLATAAALKVLADSITESVTSIQKDLAGKLNPRGEWVVGEYKANDQVTLNGQMFVAVIDNSDCPIVPLTNENGAYLVDENNNIIVPVDENGHMTYSSSWKPYTSNEALEDNLKEFKTGTQATFKIMSDNIDSKVSSTTFNALGKIVNQQSSDISQFPSKITESISTSVEENGIIYKAVTSSFALDGNKVKIFGKEIDISGAVVFTDISNEIKDAKDTATQANEELSDYKAAMVTTINGLQSQIDGEVDSWFNQVDPTTSNIPASEWTTDVLKQRHANDTYTNTNTGASWKWILTNNVWGWTPIADTATQKALANAAKAQDTADGKRRVFTVQPTSDSAYEIGDVWVNATYGTMFTNDFLVCLTAKASGAAFNIAHWQLASKYTDDTAAQAAFHELSDYKTAMVTTINGLQSQIDGEIDSWFNQVDPTTSNAPASDWTTDTLKQRHANDTYTNTNTGASWKWIQTNGVWGWTPIADTATQKALANAAKAQDTADGKRRVFTVQPTSDSAYEIGDVWVNATYGTMFTNDFLVCLTAKATGAAFNITHWKLASKYTDDTAAKKAQDDATAALKYKETFAQGLGFDSYADLEQAAEAGKTIIKGGKINTDIIDVIGVVAKGLVAQMVQAATLQTIHNSGEAYVDIQKGIIDIYGTVARNIQFGVNDQGMAVLKYFNNDGINLYDLGPNGMDTKNLQTAQWQEIQYVRVLSMMQSVPAEGLVSSENASVLFRLNTTWNLTTLYIYHAGKINNTIVSDSANGFTTAADAAAANGKIFTDKHAGNLAYDTYTDNNGSHMITGSDVMKEYRVIQGGVSTTYFWRCSLETFNMINGNY